MEHKPGNRQLAAEREGQTLAFWRTHKIFEKSLERTRGRESFVFYDGPPFATGLPHYGHLLASIIKDAVPRYHTMRGKYVPRRWGWDCHGLPIENVVEEKLGLKSKKDIITYGIDKFNEVAKKEVLRYADDWKEIIPRIGRWVDMEDDYKTMDAPYTETVWWIFKRLYDKGLIYEDYKSMHLCPRCETTLANFEVSLGYKDIEDVSVTVKFKLNPGQTIGDMVTDDRTYILAWTTTPWTLPGNVALAVGEEIDYKLLRVVISDLERIKKGDTFIFAYNFEVLKNTFGGTFDNRKRNGLDLSLNFENEGNVGFKEVGTCKGISLKGLSYQPVFDYFVSDENIQNRENGWKIYAADFVKTEEGTGVVHIAPAFGDDDMKLGREHKLPFIQHVTRDGKFVPEVTDFAGRMAKPKDIGLQRKVDEDILVKLKERDAYFSEKKHPHSYPHCWRCDTPLLNYAASSWFVRVSAIKDTLIKNNNTITWVPEHIKEGRFGKGLETAPDWAISRSRFWGAPIPVWRCASCKEIEVAGSLEDLDKKRFTRPTTLVLVRHGERDDIPLEVANDPKRHKEITLRCSIETDTAHVTEHGKKMVRDLAERLKKEGGVDAVVSSDFVRTRETAEMLGDVLGVPVSYDDRLRELQHGPMFEGKTVEEYYAFFTTPLERFTKAPEGGESLHDARRRMMQAVRDIASVYEGKRVVIVGHGDPLWMLEGTLRNMTDEEILASRATEYPRQGEAREVVVPNYPFNHDGEIDFHRPYSDAVKLACSCGGHMERIPEVFDCWFESGSMPYGQTHYMGVPQEDFDPATGKGFPADFIAEGLDQTRGWFYSLHVLAGGLFETPAFKNVLVNGLILAENGQKMSKRLKNYPDPMDIVERYGADALRLYLLGSPAVVAEDLRFSEKGVDEVSKKIIQRMSNILSFYDMYKVSEKTTYSLESAVHVLDQYLLYKLSLFANAVTQATETYRLDRVVREIADFVDMFSTVYLQYSRDRFKDGVEGSKEALSVYAYTLREMTKIVAPFMPFLAENIYQRIGGEQESVHLEDWPVFDEQIAAFSDTVTQMERVENAIELLLRERATHAVPVRQPLKRAWVAGLPEGDAYQDIIRKRVNVEELAEKEFSEGVYAELDTTITPELREQGMVRELVRGVQDLRKKAGCVPGDTITLHLVILKEEDVYKRHVSDIQKLVGADSISFEDEEGDDAYTEIHDAVRARVEKVS